MGGAPRPAPRGARNGARALGPSPRPTSQRSGLAEALWASGRVRAPWSSSSAASGRTLRSALRSGLAAAPGASRMVKAALHNPCSTATAGATRVVIAMPLRAASGRNMAAPFWTSGRDARSTQLAASCASWMVKAALLCAWGRNPRCTQLAAQATGASQAVSTTSLWARGARQGRCASGDAQRPGDT